MSKYVIFLFVFLFIGCSFKADMDSWRNKSVNAFESYKKDFLSLKDTLAMRELKRAVEYAKDGADFEMLGDIYLGKCALNISVGIKDRCQEYKKLKTIIHSKSKEAYYAMLQENIQKQDIQYLPKQYRAFVLHVKGRKYKKAQQDIKNMQNITSKLIGASLIKDELNQEIVKYLINEASFYGYRKSVIFWLKILKTKTIKEDVKQKIDRKIKILKHPT